MAENPERISRLLAVTGVDLADLRDLARAPAFLAEVLNHILGDPQMLEECMAQTGHDAATLERARLELSGGDWERDTA